MNTPNKATTAFEAELIALIPQLRAFGRTLSGSATEGDDLAQEALLKAFAARSRFEMGTNMKAWTFLILRNIFYSGKRREWRTCGLDPEVAERTLVSAADPLAPIELDELRRAMSMLPLEQLESLVLITAAGLSYDEAAEIMGTAVGTVKSRVSRARDRLDAILTKADLVKDDLPAHAATDVIMQWAKDFAQRRAA
jgi:RNA polymerase sigma-70 factor (ECF subfamily)